MIQQPPFHTQKETKIEKQLAAIILAIEKL
jgi:hypothetical protein